VAAIKQVRLENKRCCYETTFSERCPADFREGDFFEIETWNAR
jgi:hypothetical protein